jgi:hypothetical protein
MTEIAAGTSYMPIRQPSYGRCQLGKMAGEAECAKQLSKALGLFLQLLS